MEKPGPKQTPQLPDNSVPGQPGPMAPPDHPVPWEADATVGLTQGHAVEDEHYDSGEADLVHPRSDRNTRENTSPPKPEGRHEER